MLAITGDQLDQLISSFVDKALAISFDASCIRKESTNQGCQTSEDARLIRVKEHLHESREVTEKAKNELETYKKGYLELYEKINKQMKLLEFQSEE